MFIAYYIKRLLEQPNAARARLYLGITPGGGSVNFSAGTTSNDLSAVTFSNSNGVSFGLNAGTLTASVAPAGGGLTNVNLSAGTTSQNLSKFVFSNSNNVSFGLNGSTVTAIATQASSQGSVNFSAGTTSNLLSQVSFKDTNGVSFGLDAGTITASVGVTATGLTNINVSAGASSANLSAVTFSNANNVSFGLSNGTVTASIPPIALQSVQSATWSAEGNTNTDFNSTQVVAQSLHVVGGSNITVGFSNSSLVIDGLGSGASSLPRLDQVLDPNTDKVFSMSGDVLQFAWGTGGSISTNATRMGLFELDFQGHLTSEGDLVHIHEHSPNPGTIDLVHIEASGTDVTCLKLIAGASVAAEINKPVKFLMSANTSPFILDSNASSVVASLNADLLDGKHSSELTAAAGMSELVVAASGSTNSVTQLTFSNANNVSFGLNGSVVTASASNAANALQSYWQNLPGPVNFATASLYSSNTSGIFPVLLPYPMSWNYVRFWGTFGSAANATFATSNVNQSFSGAHFSTVNCVLYSLGTGTDSRNLLSVTSFSTGMTQLFAVSEQSGQYTKGTSFSYPYRGTSSATGVQQSITATNINAGSTAAYSTGFFNNRWLDVPAGFTVAAGAYWLAVGIMRASSSNVVSNLLQNSVPFSFLHVSNWNAGANNLGELGRNMNSDGGAQLMVGLGQMVTAGTTGTLSAYAISDILTQGSYMMPFMQAIGSGPV